jgi:hypothetical protein
VLMKGLVDFRGIAKPRFNDRLIDSGCRNAPQTMQRCRGYSPIHFGAAGDHRAHHLL